MAQPVCSEEAAGRGLDALASKAYLVRNSQNAVSPLPFGPWMTAATTGLAAALSLASFDLILSVVFGRFGALREAAGVTTYFAGSFVVVAAIYVLLWVVVGLPAKLVFKLPASALSVGLATTVVFPLFPWRVESREPRHPKTCR